MRRLLEAHPPGAKPLPLPCHKFCLCLIQAKVTSTLQATRNQATIYLKAYFHHCLGLENTEFIGRNLR